MKAKELNNLLKNSVIYPLLSDFGKRMFFPSKGILQQSLEAKNKANLYNVTIGIATENKQAMHLEAISKQINLEDKSYFNYASSFGFTPLREEWKKIQIKKNPSLKDKSYSLPIVCNALTQAIFVASQLFFDDQQEVIMPDIYWGNYNLLFKEAFNMKIKTFAFFNDDNEFNQQGFKDICSEQSKTKDRINIIFNFPNNPTGYSLLKRDLEPLLNTLLHFANQGKKICILCDDAYFGLFFESDVLKESLFAYLVDLHPNILAIKLDGGTKEDFIWGFRCGFISFAHKGITSDMIKVIEAKTAAAIRSSLSNISNLSQQIFYNALRDNDYYHQKEEKIQILQDRYQQIKKFTSTEEFSNYFKVLPFNSGYFFTMRILFDIDSDSFRKYLLDYKQIGVISLPNKLLRIAFSCIEKEDIADLINIIITSAKEIISS